MGAIGFAADGSAAARLSTAAVGGPTESAGAPLDASSPRVHATKLSPIPRAIPRTPRCIACSLARNRADDISLDGRIRIPR